MMKPLMDVLPCFGAMPMAFVRKPKIDFNLQILKMNVMNLPGVSTLVESFLKDTLASYFVWPNKYVFEILELAPSVRTALWQEQNAGLLTVTVIRATSLRDVGVVGVSDPYCCVYFGSVSPSPRSSIFTLPYLPKEPTDLTSVCLCGMNDVNRRNGKQVIKRIH
jgi:Ca2+-dependent lipid-binding protein